MLSIVLQSKATTYLLRHSAAVAPSPSRRQRTAPSSRSSYYTSRQGAPQHPRSLWAACPCLLAWGSYSGWTGRSSSHWNQLTQQGTRERGAGCCLTHPQHLSGKRPGPRKQFGKKSMGRIGPSRFQLASEIYFLFTYFGIGIRQDESVRRQI